MTIAGLMLIAVGIGVMWYAYVGYPLLMRALPGRPPRPPLLPSAAQVSIVVAARGAGSAVARKVDDLMRGAATNAEIVVVLDGPDPEAESALANRRGPGLTLVTLPEPGGKAVALNHGVAASRGDVLIFTDLRQKLVPGAVERLAECLRSPDVGAVSGALEIAEGRAGPGLLDRYWRGERRLRSDEARWDSSVGVTGAIYALRRSLWRPLPRGLLLDDLWIPMRVVLAGLRVGFEPSAAALDVALESDASELARKVRTQTGVYQLMVWMPEVLNPFKNRIWWQFISHKALRLLTPAASLAVLVGVMLALGARVAWVGTALACMVVAALVLARVPGGGVLGILRSALMLQWALVLAAWNALAGRWDVWSDPARRAAGYR